MSDQAYYERCGPEIFRPSGHVQGAWNDHEQHLAPVCGLLAHVIEQCAPRPDLQLARIAYDVLGLIPLAESRVTARMLRPGRTIELLEGTVEVAGRTVVRATAWRLARADTRAVEGGLPAPMPGVDAVPPWRGSSVWGGGYIASLLVHRGHDATPGRARAWLRSDIALLAEEEVSPTASFLRLVDTANGIATRVSPRDWMFPNVDLTVHFVREPVGEWLGLDTSVAFGGGGLGLTSSWLHDRRGPVGRAEQALTLRPMPR